MHRWQDRLVSEGESLMLVLSGIAKRNKRVCSVWIVGTQIHG